MVPFGGWDMPLEYTGIVAEHMAVRTRVGVFDVSHMGEIEVDGKDALALLQKVTCNDVSRLKVNQAQYSGLMNPQGGFVDDLLVHRMAEEHYLLCVNAARREADFDWIISQNDTNARVRNSSDDSCIFKRHIPSAERDHVRSHAAMGFMQRRFAQCRSLCGDCKQPSAPARRRSERHSGSKIRRKNKLTFASLGSQGGRRCASLQIARSLTNGLRLI